jgi:hypothetical protein
MSHPSGHPGGNRPRCIQVVCIEGQENDETVAGAMTENPVRHNGRKPTILS